MHKGMSRKSKDILFISPIFYLATKKDTDTLKL